MSIRKPADYEAIYSRALFEDVIPFWMTHSPDREFGGYLHSLDRDGSAIDTEKFMWPLNREIWVFSALCNSIENRPEWLEMAKLGADFLKKHGRDPNGDWYFVLARDGSPVVQAYNLFAECFVAVGFAEYAKAAGDEEALDIALDAYERFQGRRPNPKGKYEKVLPGARPFKALTFSMATINMSVVLSRIRPDDKCEALIRQDIDAILRDFIDADGRVIRENVTMDGKCDDSSYIGRHINPGHGIEAMWFIMEAAAERGDQETIAKAAEAIKWSLDFGWDKEYGGIYYFMDRLGKPHIELQWDMKLWWPQVETLIATLMAYRYTGDRLFYDWFEKIHDYTWAIFPDVEHGEWFGYANRQGEINIPCKGNRWKCCFHIPRALLMIAELCRDIQKSQEIPG